jgi:hypothetical protein
MVLVLSMDDALRAYTLAIALEAIVHNFLLRVLAAVAFFDEGRAGDHRRFGD